MSRIFVLAAVLACAAGAATAQDRLMVITFMDGTQKSIDVGTVASVGHATDTWTAYATGTYLFAYDMDAVVFEGFGDRQEGLTLYRHDADPKLWKITGWGPGGVDFTFHCDEALGMDEPGQVVVDDVFTGVVSDTYGNVNVRDYGNYYFLGSEGAWSTYDPRTGTFSFALVYYSALGFGVFSEGFELFQIDCFLCVTV